MFELLLSSFLQLFTWPTFGYLIFGVLLGMAIGILPGLGGLTGMVILLPIAFTLDPIDAIAMMMGMIAVGQTTDTIPAVLLGVPGTSAAAATVMDGYPLAQQGQAARALGAAYFSSMIGGIIGAAILLASIPVARSVLSVIGVPETFMLAMTGLVFVASLSRGSPLKGIAMAMLGLLLSTVGRESQSGRLRYDFGSFYLWEGLELVPIVLGLFAIPELIALAASRGSIARETPYQSSIRLQLYGMWDAVRHWFLIVRSSLIGVWIGFVPGIGGAVADWAAYAWARQTSRNEYFGKGDIRGVIAPECSNNAVKGGDLIPTVAFGIPGSPAMAVLLAALLNVGVMPGMTMLTDRLDVTLTMVVTLAVANVVATGLCLLFTNQLVKVVHLQHFYIIAFVLPVLIASTLLTNARFFDVYLLLVFGGLGFFMKLYGWPRAPFLIAFVLGPIIERNLIISVSFYGWSWLLRPATIGLGLLALAVLISGMRRHSRPRGLVPAPQEAAK